MLDRQSAVSLGSSDMLDAALMQVHLVRGEEAERWALV